MSHQILTDDGANALYGYVLQKKAGPIGQAVKTPPFHGGNRGSSPLWVTILFGAAEVNQGPVVQLVRMPACHAGGRGFEPLLGRHLKIKYAGVAQQVEQLTCNQ